jgi:hypothetical protein
VLKVRFDSPGTGIDSSKDSDSIAMNGSAGALQYPSLLDEYEDQPNEERRSDKAVRKVKKEEDGDEKKISQSNQEMKDALAKMRRSLQDAGKELDEDR